jgi:hypothetical protein
VAKAAVEAVVRRSPRLFGLPRSRWRLADLGQALPWLRGRAPASVRRVLRRLRVAHKRGRRYLHSPDLADDAKLAAITAVQLFARHDPGRVALLYQDELTYHRRPTVAAAWAPVGADAPRAAQGLRRDQTRRAAACVDAITGQVVVWQRRHFDRGTLARFFRAVAAAYPAHERVVVALDNWPVHFHPDLLAALPPRLELLPLPTYAPWTNPVEDLWRGLFADVLHHHGFGDDWDGLRTETDAWFAARQADPAAVLHLVGLWPD